MISAADNVALEERYLREVWEERNPEAEARFAAPNYRRYISPLDPPLDLAALIEREKAFFVAFPDGSIEAQHIIADERGVVIQGIGRGTHLGEWPGFAPTRRTVGRPGSPGHGASTRPLSRRDRVGWRKRRRSVCRGQQGVARGVSR